MSFLVDRLTAPNIHISSEKRNGTMCNIETLRLNILLCGFFLNSFLAYGVRRQARARVLYIVPAANGAS